MKSWRGSFNIYFTVVLLFVVAGCRSSGRAKDEKKMSAMHLFLETAEDGSPGNGRVLVTRQKIPMTIQREPFVTELDVAHASLIDDTGGFSIMVAFNEHGTLALDMATVGSKGRHIAVRTQYPDFTRWVAAPMITGRIANGVLQFSPDTTREEAVRIVAGLNKVAKANKKENN
jgi:hypothetical protein